MNYVRDKRHNSTSKPPIDIVKANKELNAPFVKPYSGQTLESAFQQDTMKQPSRMRTMAYSPHTDSSAYEDSVDTSDFIGSPGSQLPPNGLLVSARYNRRRASSQSVKFCLPEAEVVRRKDKVFHKSVPALVDEDGDSNEGFNDNVSRLPGWADDRRMSAPELPPIANSGKHQGLVSTATLNGRSNTFHNYKFESERKTNNRNSIHSDSSLQRYRIASQSRTSSSSSQKSRTRVLSAGTDGRTHRQGLTDHMMKETPEPLGLKLESPQKKNGMTAVVAPARCTSVTGYRRTKSKLSLNNNAQQVSTPRKIVHSESETHLGQMKSKQQDAKGLKRNCSDKSLTDLKKNVKNNQNSMRNDKVSSAAKQRTVNGNINGMRKFSSTLALTAKEERKSDTGSADRLDGYDSDTDSEKDQRVLEWIIGVHEVAEPPEEPTIDYVDEPPQRDTAIRIVYDGDS